MHKVLELPTRENSLLDAEAVKIQPIYARKEVIARLFGISKITVYRILKRAEAEEYEKQLTIDVSSNCTLIHIKNFEDFLKTHVHKKHY